MKKVTITLTDEQFDAMADAAEWVSRFLSGQIDEFTWPAGLRFSDRYQSRKESIDQALQNLKHHLFPELDSGTSYGILSDQTVDAPARMRAVLYEVYRTMLEYRTQQKIDAGQDMSLSVYSRAGLNVTGLPKPLIQSVNS